MIFISYRRTDSCYAAGWIYQRLQWAFGDHAVFFDRTSITPGMEWPTRIRESLDRARVVLLIIGPDWLNSTDDEGQRRLWQTHDWVRQEVIASLSAVNGKRVIPIFVNFDDKKQKEFTEQLSQASELPEEFLRIPAIQSRQIRELPDFEADIADLIQHLGAATGCRSAPYQLKARREQVARQVNDGGNRGRMIEKVRNAWIQGMLEKVLRGTDGFNLSMDHAPNAILTPFNQAAYALPDSRDIAEVFHQFAQRLLILGNPGGGRPSFYSNSRASCCLILSTTQNPLYLSFSISRLGELAGPPWING